MRITRRWLTTLRSRRSEVADEVVRCEDRVRHLHGDATLVRGTRVSGTRDLLGARARLAQVERELRRIAPR